MKRLYLAVAALIIFAFAGNQHASADAMYTLNYDGCSTGCGNGSGTQNNNFGYVTLHQVSANQVTVTLQITDPSFIVNTGNGSNHAPLAFNTDTAIAISGIADQYSTTSSFFTVGAPNTIISGLGQFGYEISCTTNCPAGASHGGAGDYLSFTATATSGTLSISDFIANGNGYYFASDIIGPSGLTGEVASNLAPTTTGGGGGNGGSSVPEPGSLALLGSGLIALGSSRRFLRRPLALMFGR